MNKTKFIKDFNKYLSPMTLSISDVSKISPQDIHKIKEDPIKEGDKVFALYYKGSNTSPKELKTLYNRGHLTKKDYTILKKHIDTSKDFAAGIIANHYNNNYEMWSFTEPSFRGQGLNTILRIILIVYMRLFYPTATISSYAGALESKHILKKLKDFEVMCLCPPKFKHRCKCEEGYTNLILPPTKPLNYENYLNILKRKSDNSTRSINKYFNNDIVNFTGY